MSRPLSKALTRELIIHKVPEQARKLADLIRVLTYDHEPPRDAVPVDDLADLQDALLIHDRRDFERAEQLLVKLKIIRVLRGGGRWWYEPLPLPDEWPDRPAGRKLRDGGISSRAPSFDAMERARDAWARLDQADSRQRELDLALTPEQKYADRQEVEAEHEAAGNRAKALQRETSRELRESALAEVGEIPPKLDCLAEVQRLLGGNSPKTAEAAGKMGEIPPNRDSGGSVEREFGGNSPVLREIPPESLGEIPPDYSRLRVRARNHDHDIEPTALMNHDHESCRAEGEALLRAPVMIGTAQLSPLQQDLLDRLRRDLEAYGEFLTASYEHTWTKRLIDAPKAVIFAIEQGEIALKENRVECTLGGLMNACFLDATRKKPAKWRQKPR